MEIKKWVEIEDVFTEKYGWELGVKAMCGIKRNLYGNKFLEDLSVSQENALVKSLRHFYKKKDIKDVEEIKKRKS